MVRLRDHFSPNQLSAHQSGHREAVDTYNFAYIGQGTRSTLYEDARSFSSGFAWLSEDQKTLESIKPGDCVEVEVEQMSTLGEAAAPSIAIVLDVLQLDDDHTGSSSTKTSRHGAKAAAAAAGGGGTGRTGAPSACGAAAAGDDRHSSSNKKTCLVALQYFWRFGQIFYGSDLKPETALRYKAEIFLQKDLCWDGQHHVKDPVNGYKELVPAVFINRKVEVKTYHQVIEYDPTDPCAVMPSPQLIKERLEAYETSWQPEKEEEGSGGVRADRFWYRQQFDHTKYLEFSDALDTPIKRVDLGEMDMGDNFCGAGIVAMGARYTGWAVSYGLDCDKHACSSFLINCSGTSVQPFNPPEYGKGSASCYRKTIQERVQELRTSPGQAHHPTWLHFSPPCGKVSSRNGHKDKAINKEDFT